VFKELRINKNRNKKHFYYLLSFYVLKLLNIIRHHSEVKLFLPLLGFFEENIFLENIF